MNTAKQRPILEYTAASNEFSQPARIDGAEILTHLQNRLGLRGKIKPVLGLVIVKPLQSEAIIEQHRRPLPSISDETMKSPVQPLRKFGFVFIAMNQVR